MQRACRAPSAQNATRNPGLGHTCTSIGFSTGAKPCLSRPPRGRAGGVRADLVLLQAHRQRQVRVAAAPPQQRRRKVVAGRDGLDLAVRALRQDRMSCSQATLTRPAPSLGWGTRCKNATPFLCGHACRMQVAESISCKDRAVHGSMATGGGKEELGAAPASSARGARPRPRPTCAARRWA